MGIVSTPSNLNLRYFNSMLCRPRLYYLHRSRQVQFRFYRSSTSPTSTLTRPTLYDQSHTTNLTRLTLYEHFTRPNLCDQLRATNLTRPTSIRPNLDIVILVTTALTQVEHSWPSQLVSNCLLRHSNCGRAQPCCHLPDFQRLFIPSAWPGFDIRLHIPFLFRLYEYALSNITIPLHSEPYLTEADSIQASVHSITVCLTTEQMMRTTSCSSSI